MRDLDTAPLLDKDPPVIFCLLLLDHHMILMRFGFQRGTQQSGGSSVGSAIQFYCAKMMFYCGYDFFLFSY